MSLVEASVHASDVSKVAERDWQIGSVLLSTDKFHRSTFDAPEHSTSHPIIIRLFDQSGAVIQTHEFDTRNRLVISTVQRATAKELPQFGLIAEEVTKVAAAPEQ